MIFDKIENANRYFPLHPAFEAAFNFLTRQDIAELPAEKFEVDGQNVYVMITNKPGKEFGAAKLESHSDYIDIQFLIAGAEKIGWKAYSECTKTEKSYDSEKDIEYFSDSPQTYFSLTPGSFAVFFPEDGHAPMIGEGLVHKAVVKVKIEKKQVINYSGEPYVS